MEIIIIMKKNQIKFYKPNEVLSPKDYLQIVKIIYSGDEDSYSLAKVKWDGEEVLAIRWNVAKREHNDEAKMSGKKKCVGMPSSHGYPVWFILPKDIREVLTKIK
jgi:hypothetical protein